MYPVSLEPLVPPDPSEPMFGQFFVSFGVAESFGAYELLGAVVDSPGLVVFGVVVGVCADASEIPP
jgi:hypothetical protein